jgi:hypothetical protein
VVIAGKGSIAAFVASAIASAGCGSFQDPNVVVDLRVLAITATPPTQIVDIDLDQPPSPTELLAQLVPTEVCALVADPVRQRHRWSFEMCGGGSGDRCYDSGLPLGSGVADDPKTAVPEPRMCATITPDARLLGLLLDVLRGDTLRGLGGLSYAVQLRVGGEDSDPALDEYASKTLQVVPRIPRTATANTNPRLARIDTSIDDAPPVALPLGRCVDNPTPLQVAPDLKLRMTPVEPDGVRETYVVPTLDGKSQQFTESLTYQWVASGGGFSSGSTGGPRDISGNPAPLFSDFRTPGARDLMTPTDVSIWIVQRDERHGATWYEACLRVVP